MMAGQEPHNTRCDGVVWPCRLVATISQSRWAVTSQCGRLVVVEPNQYFTFLYHFFFFVLLCLGFGVIARLPQCTAGILRMNCVLNLGYLFIWCASLCGCEHNMNSL